MPDIGIPATVNDVPTGLKCVKVYIPIGTDVHLYALRGQLSNLGKAWFWDTGGDVSLAREIAGWWVAASEATDLTALCEDCMAECNVNVNVNCGCGGGIPTTILCYDQNGNPIITPQPPTEPTVPSPSDVWPINPQIDPVPTGFADWDEFDIESCAAANGIWQAAYALVTIAEGGIDLIATIASAVAFFLPAIGASLVALLGGTAVFSLSAALVRIILSEQASDILNECRLWLETRKTEVICMIFQYRHDIPTMQLQIVRDWFAWVDSALDLNDYEQDTVKEWGRALFPLNLLLAFFFEYQRYIESSDPIDCSTCAASSGLFFWNIAGTLRDSAGIQIVDTDPVTFGQVYTLQAVNLQEPGDDPFMFAANVGLTLNNPVNVNFWLVNSVGDYVAYPTGSNGPLTQDFDHKQWVIDTGIKYGILHDGLPIVTNWQGAGSGVYGCGAPGTSAVNPWIFTFVIRPLWN